MSLIKNRFKLILELFKKYSIQMPLDQLDKESINDQDEAINSNIKIEKLKNSKFQKTTKRAW